MGTRLVLSKVFLVRKIIIIVLGFCYDFLISYIEWGEGLEVWIISKVVHDNDNSTSEEIA